MVLLCTICFHLYFHPIVQNFRKNDCFASEHSSLGKPKNIGFSLKRIYTYHSVQFRCVRAAHSRVEKDRARPTQVLIASELVRTLMTVGVYDLRCEQNKGFRAMETIH